MIPGYLAVLHLVPSGFALLHYPGEKKGFQERKGKVISARFADIQMLGDFLNDSRKRCGNVLFIEIMDKHLM